MSSGVSRALAAFALMSLLVGCESTTKTDVLFKLPGKSDAADPADTTTSSGKDAVAAATDPAAAAMAADAPLPAPAARPEPTGMTTYVAPVPRRALVEPWPSPGMTDPMDDLVLAKRHFHEENYALAEKHFRRVVEQDNIPAQRKAEAWVGLGASYDRLKRFELADRAYTAAIRIVGSTPEILNNQGFSYMLRGDYMRARAKFSQALEKDPTNPYIQNNIELLEESIRTGGGRKKV